MVTVKLIYLNLLCFHNYTCRRGMPHLYREKTVIFLLLGVLIVLEYMENIWEKYIKAPKSTSRL